MRRARFPSTRSALVRSGCLVGHQPPHLPARPGTPGTPVRVRRASLALLVADLRFPLPRGAAQRAVGGHLSAADGGVDAGRGAQLPRATSAPWSTWLENADLRRHQLGAGERLLRFEQLEQENQHLRELLQMSQRACETSSPPTSSTTRPTPSRASAILDRGTQQGMEAGLAGARRERRDRPGHPRPSGPVRVTLLTDRNQSIPVSVVATACAACSMASAAACWRCATYSPRSTSRLATAWSPRPVRRHLRSRSAGGDGDPGRSATRTPSARLECESRWRRSSAACRCPPIGRAAYPPPPPPPEPHGGALNHAPDQPFQPHPAAGQAETRFVYLSLFVALGLEYIPRRTHARPARLGGAGVGLLVRARAARDRHGAGFAFGLLMDVGLGAAMGSTRSPMSCWLYPGQRARPPRAVVPRLAAGAACCPCCCWRRRSWRWCAWWRGRSSPRVGVSFLSSFGSALLDAAFLPAVAAAVPAGRAR